MPAGEFEQFVVDVLVLGSKIRSVRAHAGVIVSTAQFQRGALEFAKSHGVALVQVTDGRFTFVQRSTSPDPTPPSREAPRRSPVRRAAPLAALPSGRAYGGIWVDPDAGRIPFRGYAERWVAERPVRPRTREIYEGQLRHIVTVFAALFGPCLAVVRMSDACSAKRAASSCSR
jgi:hypothetical protein